MIGSLLVVSAVLPSLLIVWFFHARDTFPEPPRVVWATFGLGVLAVVPAVILGLLVEPAFIGRGVMSAAAFDAFVIAALCEEGAKLSVLLLYSFRHSAFDEPMDGIVYGATVSLGFAAIENVMYVADGGFGVALTRALFSVPGHATYGAVMGYYVGRARFDVERRWRLVARGLLAAVLLHGFYDFPLMALQPQAAATGGGAPLDGAGLSDGTLALLLMLGLGAVIVGWVWALRLVARARRGQRTQPVPATASEPAGERVVRAASPWRRRIAWLGVMVGALLALAGGLVFVVGVALIVTGQVALEEAVVVAIGLTLVGGLPLLVGLAAFAAGIVALNRNPRT